MVKKRGKVPMKLAPSSSCHPDGENMARSRLKHQSLLQDYEDLIKEIEAKRQKLQTTAKNKLRLLGEIKFLRGKFKCFAQNPYQQTRCRIKKQPYKIMPPAALITRSPCSIARSNRPTVGRKYMASEAPSTSDNGVLDLNEASLPAIAEKNNEEMDYKVDREAVKIEKPKECLVDGDTVRNDIKLSVCRDVKNNSNRADKRKSTWQDQVALKV